LLQSRLSKKAWAEFTGIPRELEKLNARLVAIAAERESLDVAALEADYQNLYSARFDGRDIRGGSLDLIYLQIAQAQRKLEILAEIEPKVHAAIKTVKTRDRELAKQLDTRGHDLK
jgi:chromosome segregation ATPase